MAISRGSISKQITNSPGKRKWSDKRKRKINCKRPKGFSQKAHCQGKMKKVNEIYSGTDSGRAEKIKRYI